MFHGFKKTKGVISVFLVMILVPMLTASSVFVDASKMVLAHSVAESAADLSLNTVLTHYDRQLNEYFGLISSAQSMDEAYKTAKDFFVSCMKSQSISDEDAGALWNTVTNLFSDKESSVSDFLGIYTDEESLSIAPLEDSSLANAAIFKTQVVEFMKYRGPINAVSELFDFLKGNSEQLTKMDEITEMTEKKQEFYESESTLMQTLYDLYNCLKEYDNKKFTKDVFADIQSKTKHGGEYENKYREIHKTYVTELVNTDWYEGEYEPKTLPSSKKGVVVTKTVYETDENGASVSKKVPDMETAITKMYEAYDTYDQKRASMYSALKQCGAYDENNNCVYCKSKSSINKIQYFGIVGGFFNDNSGKFSEFYTATNNFEQAYENFLKTCEEQEEIEYDGYRVDTVTVGYATLAQETTLTKGTSYSIDTFKAEITKVYNAQKSSGGIHRYNDIQNHLQETSKEIDIGKRSEIEKQIEDLNTEILNYAKRLGEAEEILQSAIDKTDDILEALNDYTNKLNSWDNAANSSSLNASSTEGSMVQSDRDEISGKRNGDEATQGDEILKELKKEDVENLKNRLLGIKARVVFLKKAVCNCKYGTHDLTVMDLTILHKEAEETGGCNFGSFMQEDVQKNIDVFNKENIPNKTPKFFSTYEDIVSIEEVTATDLNNPSFEDKKDTFRDYLYAYFQNAEKTKSDEMSKDDAESKKDSLKSKSENGADSLDLSPLISSTEEIKDQADLPSSGSSGGTDVAQQSSKLKEVSNFVTNLFKDFKKTASEGMVNLRDDLLFSDYIMSMFSYDTYEAEGLLDYAVSEKDYKLKSATQWVSDMGEKKSDCNWDTNTDKTFKYNKTLRNNQLNTTNCFSYGNEVEYILYGKSNAENKSSAYKNIYAIRYACDLFPVFQECWNNNPAVESIATAVSAATYGIIPAPLTKLLICLGVTAAEAAVDLAAIKTGVGVKFIKGKDDLFINIENWLNDVAGDEESDKIGTELPYFQYSDYLRFFLILQLLGSGETGICKRTADVVQVNMIKLSKNNDFRLSKSNVYFKINASVKVKPLMLSLSINASDANPYTSLSELATFDYEMIRGY